MKVNGRFGGLIQNLSELNFGRFRQSNHGTKLVKNKYGIDEFRLDLVGLEIETLKHITKVCDLMQKMLNFKGGAFTEKGKTGRRKTRNIRVNVTTFRKCGYNAIDKPAKKAFAGTWYTVIKPNHKSPLGYLKRNLRRFKDQRRKRTFKTKTREFKRHMTTELNTSVKPIEAINPEKVKAG